MKHFLTQPTAVVKPLMVFLAGMLLALSGRAATVTSVQNGNWSTGSTWSTGVVPSSTDNIVVMHNVTLNGGFQTNGSGMVTIAAGASLTGTGNIALNGTNNEMRVYGTVSLGTVNFYVYPTVLTVYTGGSLTCSGDLNPYAKGLVYNYGVINVASRFNTDEVVYNEGTFKITGDAQIQMKTLTNNTKYAYFYVGGKLSLNGVKLENKSAGAVFTVAGDFAMSLSAGVGNTIDNYGYMYIGSNCSHVWKANSGAAKIYNYPTGYIYSKGQFMFDGSGNSLMLDGSMRVDCKMETHGPSTITVNDSLIAMGSVTSGSILTIPKYGYFYVKSDLFLQSKQQSELNMTGGYVQVDGDFTNGWHNPIKGTGGGIIVNGNSTNQGPVTGKVDFCDKSSVTGGKFDVNQGSIASTVAFCTFVPPAPLPVQLVSFTGKKIAGGVQLDWITSSEMNNDRFEVQRSANGANWQTIGIVRGHGTTLEMQRYSFFDEQPIDGNAYYRLHQIDFNGADEFHKVIKVSVEGGAKKIQVNALNVEIMPNPSQFDNAAVLITKTAGENAAITIVNSRGAVVYSGQLPAASEFVKLNMVQVVKQMPAGSYIVTVTTSTERASAKMEILR